MATSSTLLTLQYIFLAVLVVATCSSQSDSTDLYKQQQQLTHCHKLISVAASNTNRSIIDTIVLGNGKRLQMNIFFNCSR
ncbi:hypothetical protein EZV62_020871 [Acer yangbiense]|uniref:Pectinesterase inhibitor domain-containing protein n=1 Tax=Acer yangbiense TaxID=1000413 RepID=A0A5C7HG14_9ROSI|nr:hypothetical protein EZV62_020871 [Acer yangbiense]